MDILNKCPTCYQALLPECPGIITVDAGLDANADYYYFIVDKFGNKWKKKVTTDSDGKFDIDESDFPVGLFNAHAGIFELTIKKNPNDCDPVNMVLCSTVYSCVQIQFETVTDVSDESGSGDASALITIPCECTEESESGS